MRRRVGADHYNTVIWKGLTPAIGHIYLLFKGRFMYSRCVKLFSLAGFKVQADVSWIFLAAFITWSLATGFFPSYYRFLNIPTYWIMGIIGALGLFSSIIVHELSHSLAARKYGLPIEGITLFIFGGVAHMTKEPPSPKAEFYMAAAGPVASLGVAGLFFGAHRLGINQGLPPAIYGVFAYLWVINLALALFNLVPAFPLDGGRILRSALWKWKGNIGWATRIASYFGIGFGVLLMAYGLYTIIRGGVFNGLWYTMIGLFLRSASRRSYKSLIVTEGLRGQKIRRFIKTDVIAVSWSIPVESLVEDYMYRYQIKMLPVVRFDKLAGLVTTAEIQQIPKDQWPSRTVGEIARQITAENTVTPEADAADVLAVMGRTKIDRLLVVENGGLIGIIAKKDLLAFLSLKIELKKREMEKGGSKRSSVK